MRRIIPRDERGMALPLAVFALVIIGALVAGIFFTGRVEQRSGSNSSSCEKGVWYWVLNRFSTPSLSVPGPTSKALIRSTGIGKRMVEFFSADTSVSVCRKRN